MSEAKMMEGQSQLTLMGHYKDALRKVEDQWKFTRREIIQDVPPLGSAARNINQPIGYAIQGHALKLLSSYRNRIITSAIDSY